MKHISIRVPWHDKKWNGSVCNCPKNNPFCMMLHNISEKKDIEKEQSLSGKTFFELSSQDMPACMTENGGFMSEKSFNRTFTHVYAWNKNNPQSKLLPTEISLNPYSVFGIPLKYLNKDSQEELDKRYPNLPKDEEATFSTSWVFGRERQYAILKKFSSNIIPDSSIAVFYCKNGNPVDEDCSRLIVGMGNVKRVHEIKSYDSKAEYTYPFWDLIFEHGIRQNLDKSEGFLLPYHEYLDLDDDYINKITGKKKEEVVSEIKLSLDKLGNSQRIFNELSYGCNYISSHSMLIILDAARKCLEKVIEHKLVGGNWKKQILWIDEQIAKVKDLIGPFPSFAESLRAIGVNYAYIIEQDLRNNGFCKSKDNPWLAFDQLMSGKISLKDIVYECELPLYKDTWKSISEESRNVLSLLSRFEITSDIIEKWYGHPEKYTELLENPYIISEDCSLGEENVVTTEMIDLGVISDPNLQGQWTPKNPSLVETMIDKRRIRSLVVYQLKAALQNGDTLLSVNELERSIKNTLSSDSLQLPVNYLLTNRDFMQTILTYITPEDKYGAIQLKYYSNAEEFLRKKFKARASKSVKVPLNEDWDSLVINSIEGYDAKNERSRSAVEDQIRALKMFSDKRLSVLTGPAGTGKTTVVQAFLSSKQIKEEGVLLLAPTGKARVRLGKMAENIQAYTLAQFLSRRGFFNWSKMEAFVPANLENKGYAEAKNIIVDECSMLTCNDFYVLLNALDLKYVQRIIFIGDPSQLPPIGSGRTFADLCNFLDNNNEKAITHLKTVVRTIRTGDSDILSLASWFSGEKPAKDADQIFEKIIDKKLDKDLSVYTWNNENDLKDKLQEVLVKELPNPELDLKDRIKDSIGITDLNFAKTNPDCVERFQVLSPVINPVWGTYQLNTNFQEWVGNTNRKLSVEIAPNFIFYGDKVIQLLNEKRNSYPSKEEKQLSNGQIGFVSYANNKDKKASVVFAGIPNETFTYLPSKTDEKASVIELAYAISIHKSQGSDFDCVLVVLPKGGRILSRELIYTALTRAKKKLILLVQDSISWLMEYTKPQQSVLARRNSNLFNFSVRDNIDKIPYVEGLIHTTESGLIVRSKSEVIIANMLYEQEIKFEYEKLLQENGRRCIPDFTFEDASGDTIIWEHLGMLDNPGYRESWERKCEFYESIGFVKGKNLFTTRDHEDGSIHSNEIKEVIDELKDLI